MAWQLWAILKGVKIGQGHWAKQLDSIRSFQELFSTYNLGLFVGLNSETGTAQAKMLQELDTAIRAVCYLSPATFLYNLYWGEIFGTPWLRAYFERFKSWRSFLPERQKDPSFFDYIDVTDDFIVAMADLIKQYITVKSHGDIIANPWVFSTILRAAFEGQKTYLGDTTITAAKDFLQKVARDEDDAKPIFIKDTVIRLCNPAIDLEWIVIKMAITQLYFYDVILRKSPGAFTGRGKPRPYVKGQRYKLYENDTEVSWTPIVDEGIISVTPGEQFRDTKIATDEEIAAWKASYGEENVKVYQLDTHGIKSNKIAAVALGAPYTDWLVNCKDYQISSRYWYRHCQTTYNFAELGITAPTVRIQSHLRVKWLKSSTASVVIMQGRFGIDMAVSPKLWLPYGVWKEISFESVSGPDPFLAIHFSDVYRGWIGFRVEIFETRFLPAI